MTKISTDNLLNDFLYWAYGDVLQNINRGVFAEFLIAKALGLTARKRIEWEKYDLEYLGLKIEVKATGLVQSWHLKGDRPKKTDPSRIELGKRVKDWVADIFVMCLHDQSAEEKANPLIVTDWKFVVVSGDRFTSFVGTRKGFYVKDLIKAFVPVPYEKIKHHVNLIHSGLKNGL